MQKELLDGKLGSDGGYSVKIDGSKFVVEGSWASGVIGVNLGLSLSIKDALVALKDKIPGKIDDALIDFVVSELDKQP